MTTTVYVIDNIFSIQYYYFVKKSLINLILLRDFLRKLLYFSSLFLSNHNYCGNCVRNIFILIPSFLFLLYGVQTQKYYRHFMSSLINRLPSKGSLATFCFFANEVEMLFFSIWFREENITCLLIHLRQKKKKSRSS